MRQGEVFLSDPSPITGERELRVVVSSESYTHPQCTSVLVAEVETGTRSVAWCARATQPRRFEVS